MTIETRQETIRQAWQGAHDRLGPAGQLDGIEATVPELAEAIELARAEAVQQADLYIAGLGGLFAFQHNLALWEKTTRAALRLVPVTQALPAHSPTVRTASTAPNRRRSVGHLPEGAR